jgi:DNA-directed RNA polymerase subunit RPC12/RpoP
VVDFKCTSCGTELEADNSTVGRKVTCYKCQAEMTVPMPEFLPRVACPNCETEIDYSADEAGAILRCPKCGTAVQTPSAAGTGCGVLGLVGFTGLISIALILMF